MAFLVSLLILLAPVLPHDLRVSYARRVAGLLRGRIAGASPRLFAALARCQQRLTSLVLDIIAARACVLAGYRDELCILRAPVRSDPLSPRRMVRHLSWLIDRLDEVDALAWDELVRMRRDQMLSHILCGMAAAAPARRRRASARPARRPSHARLLELSG